MITLVVILEICGCQSSSVVQIPYGSSKCCRLQLLTYITVRVCRDEASSDEDIALTELELYIQ